MITLLYRKLRFNNIYIYHYYYTFIPKLNCKFKLYLKIKNNILIVLNTLEIN